MLRQAWKQDHQINSGVLFIYFLDNVVPLFFSMKAMFTVSDVILEIYKSNVACMIWDTRSQMGDSNFLLPNIDQKVKKNKRDKGRPWLCEFPFYFLTLLFQSDLKILGGEIRRAYNNMRLGVTVIVIRQRERPWVNASHLTALPRSR